MINLNIYLMIAIILTNLIAVGIVYQFIKKIDTKQKLLFIAISVAIMYILISITYWFSGFGIDSKVHEESKNFVIYMFVPINVILFIPYFASQYMKYKEKQIKREKFVGKIRILIPLLIIVLILEFFYFKNIQNKIITMSQKTEKQVENQITEDVNTIEE